MHSNLNIDGIQDSKSGGFSIDAHSITIKKCRNVYPVRLIKPGKKFKYNEQGEIKKTLNELLPYCTLDTAIFDNPKRSIARCALNHASYFACEYCESQASLISKKVRSNDVQKQRIQNTIEFLTSMPGTSLSLIHI